MLDKTALIVVDVQNGFTPGGYLAVDQADTIIPLINQLIGVFDLVVLTQDWHPDEHISFADNHPGAQPFDMIECSYGSQILWPRHCVQGTKDAEFHPQLNTTTAQLVVRKGCNAQVDSYSAFIEADRKTRTGLAGYLKERQIQRVYLVGIATDFCVSFSAIDASQLGFETYVIEDACQAIDLNGSLKQSWINMKEAGVIRVHSKQILIGGGD